MEMTNPPRSISVLDPLTPAMERTKFILFQPFDLGKWFLIGFSAWLAYLGQAGGGGFHVNVATPGGGGAQSFQDMLNRAEQWFRDNTDWLIPVIIGGVIASFLLGLLILWVSSRGRFMFLNCVARNTGEIAAPWKEYAMEGNSLFLFRICLSVLGSLVLLPLIGVILYQVFWMVKDQAIVRERVITVIVCIAASALFGIVFGIVGKLTHDFVVPIMYRRRIKTLAGWAELRGLLSGAKGATILYLLFGLLLATAVAVIVTLALCFTLCLAALPYLGTVILLPVYVFLRAYSLCFLEQFGEDYRLIVPESAPLPSSMPPPPTVA